MRLRRGPGMQGLEARIDTVAKVTSFQSCNYLPCRMEDHDGINAVARDVDVGIIILLLT